MTVRFYSAVVSDNADPDQAGRLKLVIPEYSGSGEYPDWVPGRLPLTGPGQEDSPGAGGWISIPEVDSIVIVQVGLNAAPEWSHAQAGEVAQVPSILRTNYPTRAGATSPDGSHGLALDDAEGFLLELADQARAVINAPGGVDVDSEGQVTLDGSEVVLNSGTRGVARMSDTVAAATNMATWIASVSTALTLTPPTDFGTISSASSTVKAG